MFSHLHVLPPQVLLEQHRCEKGFGLLTCGWTGRNVTKQWVHPPPSQAAEGLLSLSGRSWARVCGWAGELGQKQSHSAWLG